MTSTVNEAHSSIMSPGTYKDGIGKTTINIVCNDSEGYSIYVVGHSNNEFGNNKLIASRNGTPVPSQDINTGTNTSGTTSSWSMKLTPTQGLTNSNILNNYTSYRNIPSQYTKVASLVPATNIATNNTSTLETTYAVNIAPAQPAGTYTAKVKYTMVHPATSIPNEPKPATVGCISYWPNSSSVVDSMGDQCTTDTEARLWASNFQRPGYGFAGWSDKYDWVLNENDIEGNGTGLNEGYHIYGPNQTITLPSDFEAKGLSLYAVWVKSAGNLQGWNGCNAMKPSEVTALTDVRDKNTYAVAKLPEDGRCFMIENLRLGGNSPMTLSPETTEISSSFNYLYAIPSSPFILPASLLNPLPDPLALESLNCFENDEGERWYYHCDALIATNTTSPALNMTSPQDYVYSYGNYYSTTLASNTIYENYLPSGGPRLEYRSVCPNGWWNDLDLYYYPLRADSYPLNFLYTGSVAYPDWNNYPLRIYEAGRNWADYSGIAYDISRGESQYLDSDGFWEEEYDSPGSLNIGATRCFFNRT